jgi:hypothetical protein
MRALHLSGYYSVLTASVRVADVTDILVKQLFNYNNYGYFAMYEVQS